MNSNKFGFIKINQNRYISNDERFTILNTGGSVWVVLKKNEDDNYNTLFIKEPFNRAMDAMAQLRQLVAA